MAFRVTKWGLAMSKDEEISGLGERSFGLASQVECQSNDEGQIKRALTRIIEPEHE